MLRALVVITGPSGGDWPRCGEFSEGRAYQSLVQCARRHGNESFDAQVIGGAIVLRSLMDRSTTLFNRAIGVGLDEPLNESLIEQIDAFYAQSKGAWSLEMTPQASTPEALTLLKTKRLRRGLATAVLAIDCSHAEVGEISPYSIIQAEAAASQHALNAAEIESTVFGVSPPIRSLLSSAADDSRIRQWIALVRGQPVGACMTHVDGAVAWFGWSATLATHRGMGIQSALLNACVRDAAARGCRWVTSETAIGTGDSPDPSYRNMLRFGFREVYRRHVYIFVPRAAANLPSA